MSNKNHSTIGATNLLSNIVIVILICSVTFVLGQDLIPQRAATRQYVAVNTQARLNSQNALDLQRQQQRLDQQQVRHEIRTARAQSFWNGVKGVLVFLVWVMAFALIVYIVMRLIGYARHIIATTDFNYLREKSWHEMTLKHERQLAQIHVKQLAAQQDRGLFNGLSIAGNLTYNPTSRDSHDTALTQQHRQSKSLDSGLDTNSILDVTFNPTIQQTFKDLLALPTPQNHLALGYDMATQEPVYIPLASQALGAISGAGKSSTLTALASQLPKASIVLCDSHRDSEQGLTNKLAPVIDVLAIDSAESVRECKEAMSWTLEEFNERRTSGKSKDEFSPLIFIADEWLSLQRDSELASQAEHLAHTLIHEARKFNMHIWIAGQTFKTKHSTDAHHAIGQKIIGKMDAKQARMLSGMSADMLPKDTLFLNAGESYLMSWNDPTPQKVYTPFADLSSFQSAFNPLSQQSENTPLGFTQNPNETPMKADKTQINTVTDTSSLNTEQKRLLKLIKGGNSIRQAIKEVFNVSSGSKYNTKLEEVTQLIRDRMTA